MFTRYQTKIHFAHRTFKWNNEARGNAQVYCVIVGFGPEDTPKHIIHDYDTPRAEPMQRQVSRINSYLIEADNVLISGRTKPLCQVPEMVNGNKPVDGGFFFLSDQEKEELLEKEPHAQPYVKPFLGAQEFLRSQNRWCLWLNDIAPSVLKSLPLVAERVNEVRAFRLASTKGDTVRMAQFPTLFGQTRQPQSNYLLIPRHSSENRRFVPFGFFSADVILGDSCMSIPNATPYLFGILSSTMHMAWMRQVCGRIKSDFRYSGTLVYNNYPFPVSHTPKQVAAVEAAAQLVLAAREQFPAESLATLYDPLTMPPVLVKAHQQLDQAVDQCYRAAAFPTELSRLEYLFGEYRRLTEPVLGEATVVPKTKRTTKAQVQPT
ncbi:hypothetical protein K3G63_22140 [Hymenobacter sp. HSC-4F20]|nr:hypothetical protein [Hymenobacter sp. HSC-4F20]